MLADGRARGVLLEGLHITGCVTAQGAVHVARSDVTLSRCKFSNLSQPASATSGGAAVQVLDGQVQVHGCR